MTEGAADISWGAALETLRVWEYTGRVRRGYFVERMSGMQYIREGDFAGAVYALENPQANLSGCVWMTAADPLQAWGKYLTHGEGRAFANMTTTAVGLLKGEPAALFEKSGKLLRVFGEAPLNEALASFVKAYKEKSIFGGMRKVVVKEFPPEAGEELRRAGFDKGMNEYTLYGKGY
jgi:ATP-dependent Lhr-like helicase